MSNGSLRRFTPSNLKYPTDLIPAGPILVDRFPWVVAQTRNETCVTSTELETPPPLTCQASPSFVHSIVCRHRVAGSSDGWAGLSAKLVAGNVPVNVQYKTWDLGPEGPALPRFFRKTTISRFVPMSNTESSDSPQVKFVREWVQAFERKDLDIIAKSLHEDFRVVSYPQSFNQPEKTKEEWLGHLTGIIAVWTEPEACYFSY